MTLEIAFWGIMVFFMTITLLWLPLNYLLWTFTAKDKGFLEWLGRIK